MAHNLRYERLDGRSIEQNFRVLGEHMDSEHYIRWVYPQAMRPDVAASGAGVPTYGEITTVDHYVELPDAGTPTVVFKVARPEQWSLGLVELTLYYTGSTSSTAAITLRGRAKRSKVGSALPGLAVAASPTADGFFPMPGPTTAGDKLSSLWPAYLGVTPEWQAMHFFLNRNPADAYAGALRILEARLRYIPSRHEV